MKLILVKPSVEIIKPTNRIDHIAECAKVCYATEKTINEKLVQNLIDKKHLSMLRHWTRYYLVPVDKIDKLLLDIETILNYFNSEYCQIDFDKKYYYLVCNEHFYVEHKEDLQYLDEYLVDVETFENTSPIAFNMQRITFKIVTQISTSRELNRVSPNNIAEQSTRYVNFNKKRGGICAPWWLLDLMDNDVMEFTKSDIDAINCFGNNPADIYLKSCFNSFENYNELIESHLLTAQDARGVLPLDTSTICVYTYSIKEWKNIIDLRFYGTTGAPHPNAKIIAGMIRDEINSQGFNL